MVVNFRSVGPVLAWISTVGLAGLVITRRAWRELLPLSLTIVVVTLMYAPIRVEGRYTAPARPAMMVFVAAAIGYASRMR